MTPFRHRDIEFLHKTGQPSPKQKLRNILNSIFIVATIATVIIYFTVREPLKTPLYFGTGMFAVILKIIETAIRANEQTQKKKNDKRRNNTTSEPRVRETSVDE